jgi:hypothetical protein
VPAAAVIPAPGAYTKFAVVKKLVVEVVCWCCAGARSLERCFFSRAASASGFCLVAAMLPRKAPITVNKSTRSKQAFRRERSSMG